ncbi:MAG TPA: hypothetical protein VFZ09_18780 [Archangium sp.]|uniref:hypothetical protein n=1 Tax=Archangium sp. TaxID=1872627 RepID=UPI002E2FC051|nr:hypothetical protein [Archangium sp.]HEX5748292.1 hypothetical protein [Archangium sp.]
MSDEEHLDIEKLRPRRGWFRKVEEGMPEPKKYAKSCKAGKDGYLGPHSGAHHLLPQTSFFMSIEGHPNREYIENVMEVIPYHINRQSNMLGLPTFSVYDLHYQKQHTLDENQHSSGVAKGYVATFNSYKEEWRKRWLQKLTSGLANMSPEHLAIHLPVSFGHIEYNYMVADELRRRVWRVLDSEKDKHKIKKESFDAIQSALTELESKFRKHLKDRATSLQQWDKRNDSAETDWYEPYTMADTNDPLRG